MAGYRDIEPGRLGIASYEAGRTYGAGPGRVALAPPDALWAALKRLVAADPETSAGLSGIPHRFTRYDQGRLAGQIQAMAEALAVVLLGHDMVFGNAHEIVTQAARDEVAADLAATRKAAP